ncbi:unnamed protein product [Allacma fusca]|uniref:Uncharacterized protein n=1 Tax=Allacma fusca TaxID=39272 RepID=A0A8J2NVV5_9HEXA|nr:unnamed protein product [Allacma fusca]
MQRTYLNFPCSMCALKQNECLTKLGQEIKREKSLCTAGEAIIILHDLCTKVRICIPPRKGVHRCFVRSQAILVL